MDAFKIKKNGKILDYRKAEILDLDEVRNFFEREFEILDLRQENRHVIGTLKDNKRTMLLKLSTTDGVGARTENEKIWNDEFNKYSNRSNLRVPKNFKDGYFKNLYYIIMEKFEGPSLSKLNGENNISEKFVNEIIGFSELIQSLPLNIQVNDLIDFTNHQDWFTAKTKSWLDAIPSEVKTNNIEELWETVVNGAGKLEEKARHGDFTPWHLIKTGFGLGLIDAEHAHSHGVEYYDICYFIQRVHSILGKRDFALDICSKLLRRGYNKNKLKTVLASRAIGGFLDKSFHKNPNYKLEKEFKTLVLEL